MMLPPPFFTARMEIIKRCWCQSKSFENLFLIWSLNLDLITPENTSWLFLSFGFFLATILQSSWNGCLVHLLLHPISDTLLCYSYRATAGLTVTFLNSPFLVLGQSFVGSLCLDSAWVKLLRHPALHPIANTAWKECKLEVLGNSQMYEGKIRPR